MWKENNHRLKKQIAGCDIQRCWSNSEDMTGKSWKTLIKILATNEGKFTILYDCIFLKGVLIFFLNVLFDRMMAFIK